MKNEEKRIPVYIYMPMYIDIDIDVEMVFVGVTLPSRHWVHTQLLARDAEQKRNKHEKAGEYGVCEREFVTSAP